MLDHLGPGESFEPRRPIVAESVQEVVSWLSWSVRFTDGTRR